MDRLEDDADARGLGEVQVGEVAHAGREVDRSPAGGGDLDSCARGRWTSRKTHRFAVRCACTRNLALKLTRLGQDWRPHLADELDRALVEADHWAVRIRHSMRAT